MLIAMPLLFAAMMVVSGCTPEAARWSPAEAPKENKVDFITMSHPVHFAPGATTPTSVEIKALAEYLDGIAYGYGDQLTLDAGPRGASAAAGALAAKRVDAVSNALRKLHIRTQKARRPTVDSALNSDTVIVTVGRYIVTGPQCPDRSKPEADDFTNTTPSNHGCATATNLGLMVANPGDLAHGVQPGPADGEFAVRGVQLYRSGEMSKGVASGLSGGSSSTATSGGGK